MQPTRHCGDAHGLLSGTPPLQRMSLATAARCSVRMHPPADGRDKRCTSQCSVRDMKCCGRLYGVARGKSSWRTSSTTARTGGHMQRKPSHSGVSPLRAQCHLCSVCRAPGSSRGTRVGTREVPRSAGMLLRLLYGAVRSADNSTNPHVRVLSRVRSEFSDADRGRFRPIFMFCA